MPVKTRLNVMMFLEYAVKGIWVLLAPAFLAAKKADGGLEFSEARTGIIVVIPLAAGALLSPFIGQLCDRKFSTEKCLGVLLFFAGILKIITAEQTSFGAWLFLGTAFAIFYSPTMSLTNSLAMRHLADPKTEFPRTRVWGTLGWIAAGWTFSAVWLLEDLSFQWLPPFFQGTEHPEKYARMIDSLTAAGLIAIFYGLFCWFGVPKTPPVKTEVKRFALFDALALLRKRSFTVLLVISTVMSVVHMFYFLQMSKFFLAKGLEKSQLLPALSVGQLSEILVMVFLGKILTRLGFRWCIFLGAVCYALRYLIFSFTDLPIAAFVGAHALHGFCFAMFFAASFIYVDRIAPIEVRHSAQTFYTLVMFGLGPVLAALVNIVFARIAERGDDGFTLNGFSTIWTTAAAVAFVAAIAFAIFFRDEIPVEEKQQSAA